MEFKLSKYIVPSVVSMILVGTYTNVDGLFIGNVAGDDGLAAINIVWPIVAFLTSLGTGIGIGGSALLNRLRGSGKMEEVYQVRSVILFLLVAVGIGTGVVSRLLYKPLLVLMGAQGQVLLYASGYAKIICLGAVFQIMGAGLIALLRNEQKMYFSMVCCIVGLVAHLLLDMMLVEKYKLCGVAVSTVVSQGIVMFLCLLALKQQRSVRINRAYLRSVLMASTSPFGINFVPSVVLMYTNYFALKTGGTAAVSAYAVMSYAVYTFDYAFQGVCDGVQPVISYCYGSGDGGAIRSVRKCSAGILLFMAAMFVLATPALVLIMPGLFAVSGAAKKMMQTGFWIYAASYPFKAAVKFICSYYYACGKTKISNLLIYADPIVFTPLMLLLLTHIWGINGVWFSLTFAQILTSVLGQVLKYKGSDRAIRKKAG